MAKQFQCQHYVIRCLPVALTKIIHVADNHSDLNGAPRVNPLNFCVVDPLFLSAFKGYYKYRTPYWEETDTKEYLLAVPSNACRFFHDLIKFANASVFCFKLPSLSVEVCSEQITLQRLPNFFLTH